MQRLRPDGLDQHRGAQHLDHALHIVSQNAEAHLCSDVFESFGEEGRTAHPGFERAKDMFNRLSPHTHGIRQQIEACLHLIQYRLMRPSLHPLHLFRRTARSELKGMAGGKVAVVADLTLSIRTDFAPRQMGSGRTGVAILSSVIDEVGPLQRGPA